MTNTIELKSINNLIKEKFFISTYQRGYRWDKQQVTELLDDIYEFMQKGNVVNGEFYCLQPIVVKKRDDDRYDVIDGQQRLTTFLIIQKYLKKKTFQIEYATRKGSGLFLDKISEYVENDDKLAEKNVDYFYMKEAYKTIENWFLAAEERDEYTLPDKFNYYLGEYCKVIWYEVDADAISESIFTRLNIGKIPLTNAELVKALFLRKRNFGGEKEETYLKQIEIASEWDEIERMLQDNKLWYFINPPYSEMPATRIEYIFDLIAGKKQKAYANYTFIEFSKMLENESIKDVWSRIKDCFRIINEWYLDQKMYHLIGFLTSSKKSNVTVSTLVETYYSKCFRKSEFEQYVINCIRSTFMNTKIDDLCYDSTQPEKDMIRDILLLFNVVTVMNKSNAYSRFPFDSYNSSNWSLEHIHAQNTEGMRNKKELWTAWIDEHLKSFEQFTGEKYEEIVRMLRAVDRDHLDYDEFERLFNSICAIIEDDYGSDLHAIDNLALLDQGNNSSISNSFFDVKRRMIIEKDRRGEFIPVCTRNVFLKYYSRDPSQIHYWSASDRSDYLQTIKDTLAPYLAGEDVQQ